MHNKSIKKKERDENGIHGMRCKYQILAKWSKCISKYRTEQIFLDINNIECDSPVISG